MIGRLSSTIDWFSGLLPAPTPVQVRRHLRLGLILRWVLIAVIAAAVMLTPQFAGILLYILLAAGVYNAVVTVVLARVPQAWDRRIALVVTLIDQLFCFVFLGLYSTHVPGTQPLGGYSMATIEAVAYFGAWGAVLSVVVFQLAAAAVIVLRLPLFAHLFAGAGTFNSVLMLATIAVVLVAVLRTRLLPDEEVRPESNGHAALIAVPNGKPAVHLSRREHEVLRLVAEGYSNTMIARRLQLSESTVNGYVENLLFHLNVRNRAEAVAAASRLHLL